MWEQSYNPYGISEDVLLDFRKLTLFWKIRFNFYSKGEKQKNITFEEFSRKAHY